jgi:hypothetical protein
LQSEARSLLVEAIARAQFVMEGIQAFAARQQYKSALNGDVLGIALGRTLARSAGDRTTRAPDSRSLYGAMEDASCGSSSCSLSINSDRRRGRGGVSFHSMRSRSPIS